MRVAFICSTLAFFLTACAGTYAPAAVPTDTQAPSAAPAPTPTITPTPFVEPTLALPSATPTVDLAAPDAWACKVRSQSVRNGSSFDPKERFDMAWQVKNAGMATWEPESIKATYLSGSRMQVNDVVNLRESVNTDRLTQFVVPMIAPRSSGRYTTVWALWYGANDFCHMTVTIVVR